MRRPTSIQANRIVTYLRVCVPSCELASIGINVEASEITTGNVDLNRMAGVETVTRWQQDNLDGINLTGVHQFFLI